MYNMICMLFLNKPKNFSKKCKLIERMVYRALKLNIPKFTYTEHKSKTNIARTTGTYILMTYLREIINLNPDGKEKR